MAVILSAKMLLFKVSFWRVSWRQINNFFIFIFLVFIVPLNEDAEILQKILHTVKIIKLFKILHIRKNKLVRLYLTMIFRLVHICGQGQGPTVEENTWKVLHFR